MQASDDASIDQVLLTTRALMMATLLCSVVCGVYNGLWYAAAYVASITALTASLWVLLGLKEVPPPRIAARRYGPYAAALAAGLGLLAGSWQAAAAAAAVMCAASTCMFGLNWVMTHHVPMDSYVAKSRSSLVYAVQLVGFSVDFFAADQVVNAVVCGCDIACTLLLVVLGLLALLTLWLGHCRPTMECDGCDTTNILYKCAPNTGAGSPTCWQWKLRRLEGGLPQLMRVEAKFNEISVVLNSIPTVVGNTVQKLKRLIADLRRELGALRSAMSFSIPGLRIPGASCSIVGVDPCKWVASTIEDIINGVVKPIMRAIQSAVAAAFSAIMQPIKKVIAGIRHSINTFFKDMWKSISTLNVFKPLVQQALDLLTLLQLLDPWLALQMYVNPLVRDAILSTPLYFCVPFCNLKCIIVTALLIYFAPLISTCCVACAAATAVTRVVLSV